MLKPGRQTGALALYWRFSATGTELTMAKHTANRSMGTVALRWHGDSLELLDQRLLPAEEHWIKAEGASGVAQCITDMVVRGAPAIGISAAYGVALAARHAGAGDWRAEVHKAKIGRASCRERV